MTKANDIQAILFTVAETKTVGELAKLLQCEKEEIETGLARLAQSLDGTALTLIRSNDEVTLATRSEHSTLLEQLKKEELSKELSKASAETLSIICYYPGVSRVQIEFIRGVNATYSIRALLMRGLAELRGSGRGSGYFPTNAMLAHFGVASLTDMPKYKETHEKIAQLLTNDVIPESL